MPNETPKEWAMRAIWRTVAELEADGRWKPRRPARWVPRHPIEAQDATEEWGGA